MADAQASVAVDVESMNFDIKLTGREANVVLAGLAELPAKNSYEVINKIKSQAEQQVSKASQPQEAAPGPGQQLLTEG